MDACVHIVDVGSVSCEGHLETRVTKVTFTSHSIKIRKRMSGL